MSPGLLGDVRERNQRTPRPLDLSHDGATLPPRPPQPNGYIIYNYPASDCALFGQTFVGAACSSTQDACLDAYTNLADPIPAGNVQVQATCPASREVPVPPGTYTYSAGIVGANGMVHLINTKNVVVVSGQITVVRQ